MWPYPAAAGADKIASVLVDASGCLQGGIQLRLPDEKYVNQYDLRPGAFTQAANEPAVAKQTEECLADWCNQVRSCSATPGPGTKLPAFCCRTSCVNRIGARNNSRLPQVLCACAAAAPVLPGHQRCLLLLPVSQIDGLLRETNVIPAGEEPGPATELEYWRKQMARINSLTEQLKRRECKLVLGVANAMHSPVST